MKNASHHKIIKPVLFTIALLDYMGFTIAATVFPSLLLDSQYHILPISFGHDMRLMLIGLLLAVYPLGQFLSASILGSASDRWGRRAVLIITLIGTVIACLLTALSVSYGWGIILFVSRFTLGLFAGNVSVAQASIVDISDQKNKASNISLIQLSLGLAWVFGAPIGSFLSNSAIVNWFNYATPFWALFFALSILLLLVTLFFPETLETRNVSQKVHLLKSFVLTYDSLSHQQYRDIFFVWMLFICGWAMFLQFLPAFLILNFNYTTASIGPMLAFMGGTFACSQIFIARRFLRKISAETMLKIVMLFPGIATLGVTFSHNWLQLHFFAFLFPFSMGFTLPSLLAAISNRGDATMQGKMLGMAQSLQALMTIVATLLGGKLLAMNSYLSAIVGSVLMIMGWLVFIVYVNHKSQIIKTKVGITHHAK